MNRNRNNAVEAWPSQAVGTLTLPNKPARRSRQVFTRSVMAALRARGAPVPGPLHSSLSNETRLYFVVDDNPTSLKPAADVLRCEGRTVLRANDAQEALAVLQQARPELFLMDIQRPGRDGLTLTRRLKADPACRHIRIVAFTSFAMKGDEQKPREAGCDGYITKPIDPRALASQLGECLVCYSQPTSNQTSL